MKNIVIGEYEWKFMAALAWLSAAVGALSALAFLAVAALLTISVYAMPYAFGLVVPIVLAGAYTAYSIFVTRGLSRRRGGAVAQFAALCVLNTLTALALSEWSNGRNLIIALIDVLFVLFLLACIYLIIRWWPLIGAVGRRLVE